MDNKSLLQRSGFLPVLLLTLTAVNAVLSAAKGAGQWSDAIVAVAAALAAWGALLKAPPSVDAKLAALTFSANSSLQMLAGAPCAAPGATTGSNNPTP